MKSWILLLLIVLLGWGTSHAQFILNGSAVQTNDSCWTLTPAQFNRVGSIWNETKIDLNESFQVLMQLSFGINDMDGADGIVFGFQPVSTSIGSVGEGIGFAGVSPALGIEFDTWQNTNLGDPAFDHIAIVKNGNLNHNSGNTLAGPIQASTQTPNIENGQFHQLRVNWDAAKNTLEIWFDCKLRLSYTGDIVNDIFSGDPEVFWGFTSATGGAYNVHQVCLSYTTFLDGFDDVVICPSGQFQLSVGGGVSYQCTPATGLSNPNIPNPIASPEETTTYLVEVLEDCSNPFFDSITVFVDGDTVFFELGADTTICEGEPLQLDATSFGLASVEYLWSNGATTPVVDVLFPGLYTVTVTVDQYCVSDDRIAINMIPLPGNVNIGRDTVLCFDQVLELDATTSGDPQYIWENGSTDPIRTFNSTGLYTLTVYNECGENAYTLNVGYEDCRQVFFPNAFSPNDDGMNDFFLPFDGGDVELVTYCRVFDRWGGNVYEFYNFQPNDFSVAWDGTTKGQPANQGVYAWMAEVVFRDGFVQQFEGDVVLIR